MSTMSTYKDMIVKHEKEIQELKKRISDLENSSQKAPISSPLSSTSSRYTQMNFGVPEKAIGTISVNDVMRTSKGIFQ